MTARSKTDEKTPGLSDAMNIQRLPWAGIRVEVGSTTLFVDATVNAQYKDPTLTASTPTVQALITHHHPDHYDPAALKTVFNGRSRLYCWDETVPRLNTAGLVVQPVKLHHPIDASGWADDLAAIPVPAIDGFGHPQVSWVVIGGGKRIIHCGDTLWHGYWRDIGLAYGPFDLAFLPINGARIKQGKIIDTGIPAVLTPEQAAVAGKLLQAKVVCPIHYGRVGDSYFETEEPEANFVRFAKQRGVPFILPKSGEWIK